MHVIRLDVESKPAEESTAMPTSEPTAQTTTESTIDAVVGNSSATTVDGNAVPATVENNAIPVPQPIQVVVAAPIENILIWPSMQDLNTRLRRVITSYQRNYKKEELKQQQKAKVNLSYYSVHIYTVYYTVQRHTYSVLYLKHC